MVDNNRSNPDPKFNSSIQYLDRVGVLMNTIHNYVINEQWDVAYLTLSQLYDELYPRLSKEQILEIKDYEDKTSFLWEIKQTKPRLFNDWLFIKNLKTWFRLLNTAAHNQKLIMEDKPEGWDGTV